MYRGLRCGFRRNGPHFHVDIAISQRFLPSSFSTEWPGDFDVRVFQFFMRKIEKPRHQNPPSYLGIMWIAAFFPSVTRANVKIPGSSGPIMPGQFPKKDRKMQKNGEKYQKPAWNFDVTVLHKISKTWFSLGKINVFEIFARRILTSWFCNSGEIDRGIRNKDRRLGKFGRLIRLRHRGPRLLTLGGVTLGNCADATIHIKIYIEHYAQGNLGRSPTEPGVVWIEPFFFEKKFVFSQYTEVWDAGFRDNRPHFHVNIAISERFLPFLFSTDRPGNFDARVFQFFMRKIEKPRHQNSPSYLGIM